MGTKMAPTGRREDSARVPARQDGLSELSRLRAGGGGVGGLQRSGIARQRQGIGSFRCPTIFVWQRAGPFRAPQSK
jgi:hypothetical protein